MPAAPAEKGTVSRSRLAMECWIVLLEDGSRLAPAAYSREANANVMQRNCFLAAYH